ncbi:MAG: rod shape-determining protein MreD [Lachnospiraceae bacterium]|nr:rod shape-determining protein MreD [Lachnospiraceae bacterium]
MLRKVITGLLIFLCFLLQSSVFPAISFAGIIPNLLIILTASFGFMRGEESGMLVGFFCGMLTDVLYGDILGFYALIYLYIGFVNGKFSRIFYKEDIKLPICLIVVSDLTYGLMIYLLVFLLRGRFDFIYYFTRVIIPECIYTIVVTIVLYPLILLINNRLEIGERKRAQKFV